ncbi:MAG: hypothetical protein ABI707_14645 [Ferruginibacter sp.]
MTPENNADRRKKMIIFSLVILITAGIASFLLNMLWPKDEYISQKKADTNLPFVSPVNYDILLETNGLLNNRLTSLAQLDQQYIDVLAKSNDKKETDAISKEISTQEELFSGSIDSISKGGGQPDSSLNKIFDNIIFSYKSILQSRHTVTSLRTAIDMHKDGLKPDQMAILKTQNDLQEKNRRITLLEAELKTITATKENAMKHPAGDINNLTKLKEDIAGQANRIAVLTGDNNNLKKDNDRLIKEQNNASKNVSPGELTLKNKTVSLQQKIDELNTELQLAHVDCNLSRIDAGKIISNSRQRKELLDEASGILTSLAKSDDPVTKKKAQYKIVRLNQIAANTRD